MASLNLFEESTTGGENVYFLSNAYLSSIYWTKQQQREPKSQSLFFCTYFASLTWDQESNVTSLQGFKYRQMPI